MSVRQVMVAVLTSVTIHKALTSVPATLDTNWTQTPAPVMVRSESYIYCTRPHAEVHLS